MKKIILFLFLVLFSVSCRNNSGDNDANLIITAIKENIEKSAMGISLKDLKYQSVSLDSIVTVKKGQTLSEYPKMFEGNFTSNEMLLNCLDSLATDGYSTEYGFFFKRLESLMNSDPEEIDYTIWKHVYKISNPLFNNDVTVTNYYFFDKDNKLINKISDMDYDSFKSNYKYPYPELMKYEYCLKFMN